MKKFRLTIADIRQLLALHLETVTSGGAASWQIVQDYHWSVDSAAKFDSSLTDRSGVLVVGHLRDEVESIKLQLENSDEYAATPLELTYFAHVLRWVLWRFHPDSNHRQNVDITQSATLHPSNWVISANEMQVILDAILADCEELGLSSWSSTQDFVLCIPPECQFTVLPAPGPDACKVESLCGMFESQVTLLASERPRAALKDSFAFVEILQWCEHVHTSR